MKKVSVLVVAGVIACGGREVGTTTDTGMDPGKDQGKIEVVLPDGVASDTQLPTDDPIVQVQTSKDSTECTADTIANFATGLTGTAVVVTPKFVASKDKTTGEPKLDGYFVSVVGLDQTLPYTGIEVTVSSALGTDFKPGDVVKYTGKHVEYYCMSELGLDSVEKTGSDKVPHPVTVDPAMLANPKTAEAYEGVLVRVASVTVTNANPDAPKDYGYFQVTGDLVVGNLFGCSYMNKATNARRVGDKFDEIVGVLYYTFGRYVLMPRSDADMVLAGSQGEGVVTDVPPEGVAPDVATDTSGVESGIAAIQKGPDSVNCPPDSKIDTFDKGISLKGVVVTSPKYSASSSLDAYFVADQGKTSAPFHGIVVTFPTALGTSFVPGDVIDIVGDHVEFYCLTEIKGASAERVGTANVPEPLDIDPCDLGQQDPMKAEPLEGVLVRVKDVTVENANPDTPKDYGSFTVDCGLVVGNTFKLPYMNKDTSARKVGDKFSSIVGQVTYSFGKYVLMPRTEADMVMATGVPEPKPEQPIPEVVEPSPDVLDVGPEVAPEVAQETGGPAQGPIVAIQKHDSSVTCPNPGGKATVAEGLSLDGLVVISPRFDVSYTLHGFFVAEQGATAMPWAGMLVVVQKTLGVEVTVGDVVSLTGNHDEYYCLTELSASKVEKTGTTTAPKPLDIDPCDLGTQDPAKAEPLEGVLVRVKDVTVENANPDAPNDYGKFAVDCGLIVGNQFKLPYMNKDTNDRTVGDKFSEIVGVVSYSFGQYVLYPRTEGDMVKVP